MSFARRPATALHAGPCGARLAHLLAEWTVGIEIHQKPGLVLHPLKTFGDQSEAIALLDRIMTKGGVPTA
jgi:hypothetical protein